MVSKKDSLLLIAGSDPPRLLTAASEIPVNKPDESPSFQNCSCQPQHVPSEKCGVCRLRSRVETLIRAERLTNKSWTCLVTILRVAGIENLSHVQARRLCHLLDYLMFNAPLVNHLVISGEEWQNWLDINLPNEFKQLLPIVPNDGGIVSESSKPKSKAKKKKRKKQKFAGGSGETAPADRKFEQSNPALTVKKPVRQPVSAELYQTVAIRQGSVCFWCGIRVIREQRIPISNRLGKNGATIVYLTKDGELREQAIATIDHLVRVTDGGTNDPANLVISCLNCNLERERITKAYGRPFSRPRLVCDNCGGGFFHPDWGRCSICGAGFKSNSDLNELQAGSSKGNQFYYENDVKTMRAGKHVKLLGKIFSKIFSMITLPLSRISQIVKKRKILVAGSEETGEKIENTGKIANTEKAKSDYPQKGVSTKCPQK